MTTPPKPQDQAEEHWPIVADSRIPMHHRISEDLARRIGEGVWGPNDPLPSEQTLARRYGVALGTIRRAIANIAERGLVERLQGRGTFVRRPEFGHALFRFFRLAAPDGGDAAPAARILDRAEAPLSAEAAQALNAEEGAPALRLSRLRVFNQTPLLLEEIWLPLPRFLTLVDLPLEDFGPLLYPLYERRCGQLVVRADERLTVESFEAAQARPLNRPAGAPAICIRRTAFDAADRPLEWRRSWGPADQFDYRVEIR